MGERCDAVIIGAGIIGACIARELAGRGWRTLNVDRLPAAGYGSTGASCAIIRSHYSTYDGAALAYEGFYYWRQWPEYIGVDDERGLARFHETGCLVYKTASNDYLKSVLKHTHALGIPHEEWDAARIRARLPFVDLHSFGPPKQPDHPSFGSSNGDESLGAVFFPYAGYVNDPQLAAHNAQRSAEAKGGEFRFNAQVVEVRREAGRVAGITLAGGERIDAPVVVNVAGPHSFKVNEMAGVATGMNVKTRALRQEVAHVAPPPGVEYPFVVSDSDVGCYSRPEMGSILIGSEDPECDPREWVDPDSWNDGFTEQWRNQVYRVAQRIPELGIPNREQGVVHLYDVSDDWIPIYDRSDLPGFYMAIGTSGNQFKNAPVAGVLMASLMEACENGRDHDRDPLTIELAHTGLEVNVGFYSRLRELNPESSYSVLG